MDVKINLIYGTISMLYYTMHVYIHPYRVSDIAISMVVKEQLNTLCMSSITSIHQRCTTITLKVLRLLFKLHNSIMVETAYISPFINVHFCMFEKYLDNVHITTFASKH